MIESRIEEIKEKNRFGKRTRIQIEDDLVVDEVSNEKICLDIDIQHEHLQQNNFPKSYCSNKEDGREEIDKVLDIIYVLFVTIKIKKIWKKHH